MYVHARMHVHTIAKLMPTIATIARAAMIGTRQQSSSRRTQREQMQLQLYEGFHENGSLEINAEFVNGLLHGRFIHLNTAFTKISEYSFLKGKKHGLGIIYKKDETNRVSSVTRWQQGFRDGEAMRFNDEKIQRVTTFSYKQGELYERSK